MFAFELGKYEFSNDELIIYLRNSDVAALAMTTVQSASYFFNKLKKKKVLRMGRGSIIISRQYFEHCRHNSLI